MCVFFKGVMSRTIAYFSPKKIWRHLPYESSRIAFVKLCHIVFASIIFAAVIFAPVLLWDSFPPSYSRSCVWGRGEGERGGAGGHSKSGGGGGCRGGRGMTGSSLTTVGGQSCVNECMWAGGGGRRRGGGLFFMSYHFATPTPTGLPELPFLAGAGSGSILLLILLLTGL